jgi:hypothetical protein
MKSEDEIVARLREVREKLKRRKMWARPRRRQRELGAAPWVEKAVAFWREKE